MVKAASVFALVIVVGGVAGEARAQGTGTPNYPPPNAPPPTLPPNGPPPNALNAPPVNAPDAAPPNAPIAPADPNANSNKNANSDETSEEEKDEGRIRVGFNVNGGVGSSDELGGGTIGVSVRLGYQINSLIAVYGQVSPYVWFGATDKTYAGQKLEFSAIGGFQFTPMLSLTPLNFLEFAAGPSLDRLSGGTTGASLNGTTISGTAIAYSGFYFALHGRIALHIGGKPNAKTGRRTSFTIGGDIHPTFAEGSTLTFYTLGLGADWY